MFPIVSGHVMPVTVVPIMPGILMAMDGAGSQGDIIAQMMLPIGIVTQMILI